MAGAMAAFPPLVRGNRCFAEQVRGYVACARVAARRAAPRFGVACADPAAKAPGHALAAAGGGACRARGTGLAGPVHLVLRGATPARRGARSPASSPTPACPYSPHAEPEGLL